MALTEKDKQDIAEIISGTNKSSDWRSNPLFYIVITLLISFVLNFVERKLNSDENYLVVITEIKGKIKTFESDITKLEKDHKGTNALLHKIELIVNEIKVKFDLEKENKEEAKKIEDLIKSYEEEKRTRGIVLDSTSNSSYTCNYYKFYKNNIYDNHLIQNLF